MKNLAVAVLLFASSTVWAQSGTRSADIDRIQTASTILSQIMEAPDRAIPDGIMSGAKCIAIVPSMLKASFIFGANYGKGVATCRTEAGWSSPVFFRTTGGSFGFQAGGQASDLVLIIRTDDGMQHLLQSKFQLGADASAAAGPVGRDAQASTDLTLRAQVLTYSRSRGLFAGVSVSGGVIRQDTGDTQAFYGRNYTFYSILNGEVTPPKEAEVLLKTVALYAPVPKVPGAPASRSTSGVTPTASTSPSAHSLAAPAATPTTSTTATAMPAPSAEPADSSVESATPTPTAAPDSSPDAAPATTPAAAPVVKAAPTGTEPEI